MAYPTRSGNHAFAGSDIVRFTADEGRGEHFFVVASKGKVPAWRKDKSIPMVEVVQAFKVFRGTHHTADPPTPAKGELESAFGTSNIDNVVKHILENGEIIAA